MLFPTELIATYYVPYLFDKVSRRKILAKGKLYDKYNDYRGLLIETRLTACAKGIKRKHVDIDANSKIVFLANRETLTISDIGENH